MLYLDQAEDRDPIKIFTWIENVLIQFSSKRTFDHRASSAEEDAFIRQLKSNFNSLVKISADRAFMLVEDYMGGKHDKLIDSIAEDP